MVRKQKPYFRQEDTQFVFKRWLAHESCSLVGVGSIGKSNLVHHLAAPETVRNYLSSNNGSDTLNYRAVVIDANMLGSLPSWQETDSEQFRSWAGYELIMHRLYLAFYPLDILEDDAEPFFETYQALQDGSNPLFEYMGLRYLELGFEFFMRRDVHLLLIFDEFEELIKQMPPKFFSALRGIRDRHKSQISYVTFSRSPLLRLVNHLGLPKADYEAFIELFNDNTHYVGPYRDIDANDMVANLEKRHQIQLDTLLKNDIVTLSGGYAGLIRAIFHAVLDVIENRQGSPLSLNDTHAVETLVKRPAIHAECETLWASLTNDEQYILTMLIRIENGTHSYDDLNVSAQSLQAAITTLILKRLIQIHQNPERLALYAPLFAAYIRHYQN